MTKLSPRATNAANPIGWPFYPYVVAYEKPDGAVNDCHYCLSRKEAQDFVKTLAKEYKVRVFKLKTQLLYFRAGKHAINHGNSEPMEHEVEPNASFI